MKVNVLGLLLMSLFAVFLAGCQSASKAIQKISDDLGDKALQAHAFVDIWQVTPSDPASNSAPTGKKITVIGDVKSIPLTAKNGELVKDYLEYRNTKTPAWYNSANVTQEEVIICTGDNAKELKAYLKAKLAKSGSTGGGSGASSNSAGSSETIPVTASTTQP